jgi:hypothetical protein
MTGLRPVLVLAGGVALEALRVVMAERLHRRRHFPPPRTPGVFAEFYPQRVTRHGYMFANSR